MRIWIQSSVFLPTPPPSTGALEYLVAKLAAGLASRGHDVTLFALARSHVEGVNMVLVDSFGRPYDTETALVDKMEHERRPDVLFDHSFYHLAQARWPHFPTVTVSHGEAKISAHARNLVFVSHQHGHFHGRGEPEVMHICIDAADYPLGPATRLRTQPPLFLGRLIPYKRPHLAIDLATRAGQGITLAGPIGDQDYYAAEVSPRLAANAGARYIGEIAGANKAEWLRNSVCLLFPSEAKEPAGVVMLEAMASGAPVFAFDHGANREFIVQAETGYLARDEDDMVEALGARLWRDIKAADCRRHVEEHFSVPAMVERAEQLLGRAMKGEVWK